MYANSESKFVRHGPCSSCGSRDNVAWYSNGTGFCFGCGKLHRGTPTGSQRPSGGSENGTPNLSTESAGSHISSTTTELSDTVRSMPSDVGTHFPEVVLTWLKQYDIGVTDLLKYNVKWS